MLAKLQQTTDPGGQQNIIAILESVGTPQSLETLVPLADAESEIVSTAAARAITAITDRTTDVNESDPTDDDFDATATAESSANKHREQPEESEKD